MKCAHPRFSLDIHSPCVPRETAVLPLLREEQSSDGHGSGTSSVEQRVIGAGLKAIERAKDGAAVAKRFYMFAVTQEDFVHPIAVIELLWRSCCASEAEKQAGRQLPVEDDRRLTDCMGSIRLHKAP